MKSIVCLQLNVDSNEQNESSKCGAEAIDDNKEQVP